MGREGLKSFQNLQPDNLVGELLFYIETQLPQFTNSDEFVEILVSKKNENQHSAAFCTYMTNSCLSKFYFGRENAQKNSSTIDIGVYRGANLFFTIEAKVLPTPATKKRQPHEYVYGKGAGIQRFKEEQHGVDNSDRLLSENGMIAYVKEKTFESWYQSVNQWISDAAWSESEKLQITYSKEIARLLSEHKRVNGSIVTLHHFWVYVN